MLYAIRPAQRYLIAQILTALKPGEDPLTFARAYNATTQDLALTPMLKAQGGKPFNPVYINEGEAAVFAVRDRVGTFLLKEVFPKIAESIQIKELAALVEEVATWEETGAAPAVNPEIPAYDGLEPLFAVEENLTERAVQLLQLAGALKVDLKDLLLQIQKLAEPAKG